MGLLQTDDTIAERLLSGELHPDDAPPAYAGLARIIDVATSPTAPAELTSERSVVVACLDAVRSAAPKGPTSSRSFLKLTRITPAKVVAGVLAFGFLATGTAAAATGILPTRAQTMVARALSHVGISVPRPNSESGGGSTNRGSHATSESADGTALFNQCSAFLASSSGNASGGGFGNDRYAGFSSLIASHGGTATSTTSFCKILVFNHDLHATSVPGNSGVGNAGSTSPVLGGTTSNPSKPGNSESNSTASPSGQGRATSPSTPGNSGSHPTSSPPGQTKATNPSGPGNSGSHGTGAPPGQTKAASTSVPGNSGSHGTGDPPGQTKATNPSGPGNSGSHAAG